MVTLPTDAPGTGPAVRALALFGGLALAAVALPLTVGLVLAAAAGVGLTALWRRRSGRRYTPLAGWVGGFTGAAVVTALLMGVAFALAPNPADPQVQVAMTAARAQARAQGPTAIERAVERVVPGSTAYSRASEAQTDALLESRGFRWWMYGMGLVFTSALAGVWAGTLGWGAGTVLAFGATGRWPGRRTTATDPDALDWADV